MTKQRYDLTRFLNARSAGSPTFSADNHHLAFTTNTTGMPQIWQIPLTDSDELAWPDQLTFDSDRIMGASYNPNPEDGRLLYTRDVGGNENAQIFLLDPQTNLVTNLTEGYEDTMHLMAIWIDDGKKIVFAANRRHKGLFDIYIQPVDGPAEMILQNEKAGYVGLFNLSPDGRWLAYIRISQGFDHSLMVIDLTTGQEKVLIAADGATRLNKCAFNAEGDGLFLITDRDSEFFNIVTYDLASGTITKLVDSGWDVVNMELTPDKKRLIYAINESGNRKIFAYDLATSTTTAAPSTINAPGVLMSGLAVSADSKQVAFAYSYAVRTSDIYLWNLETNSVKALTRCSHGGISAETFVAPTLITYPTFDKDETGETRQIPAWYYLPKNQGDGPMPVIVMVHGGPESQFAPYFHWLAQYFVYNGYAVLAPNVRGSSGFGKTYVRLDDVRLRMNSVKDLEYAARWLKTQPHVDGDRLVVYGGSYGGFMVLAALTNQPDMWAAGIDIVGISNFVTFLENTSDYRRAHREGEYGSLEHDREWMESIAPINHVEKIVAPLMVIHGRNDPRVPVGEAIQLVGKLELRDVPVELLIYDDEGHGLVKLHNKRDAYPKMLAFLNKHL